MKAVHPYLNFDGTTEEAFTFYRSVFGGKFTNVTRFRDMGGEAMGVPPAELDRIANIGLPVGPGSVLMGTDVVSVFPRPLEQGNNFHIALEPDTREEAERIFRALSDGGTVQMEPQQTEWAEFYVDFVDRYGVGWMISYEGSVVFGTGEEGA